MGSTRPALANILIGDATDLVCESVFRSRGHTVDFKPGMSKVCLIWCDTLVSAAVDCAVDLCFWNSQLI